MRLKNEMILKLANANFTPSGTYICTYSNEWNVSADKGYLENGISWKGCIQNHMSTMFYYGLKFNATCMGYMYIVCEKKTKLVFVAGMHRMMFDKQW